MDILTHKVKKLCKSKTRNLKKSILMNKNIPFPYLFRDIILLHMLNNTSFLGGGTEILLKEFIALL